MGSPPRCPSAVRNDSSLLFGATTTTPSYTLSLPDALPIFGDSRAYLCRDGRLFRLTRDHTLLAELSRRGDRKSTRLNSSHLGTSYAVFCLKKQRGRSRRAQARTSAPTQTPSSLAALP